MAIFNNILLIFYAGFVISSCNCIEEDLSNDKNNVTEEITTKVTTVEIDIEDAIQKVESFAIMVQQISKMDGAPTDDYESIYDHMILAIDDINDAIKSSDNIHKFIKANGFVRILSNNLINTHSRLRTKLLILLKTMFDIAPTAVDSLLPINIIDRLLDIFETDDNLPVKALALDILSKWLPNNPKAQVRVMKMKGLETFYKQLDKLDVAVIKILIELFNTILKEHLDVRNDKMQVTQDDGEKLVMYQRIGLLEHMSTPTVCNGLLNIFEMLWSYNNYDSVSIKIVLDLLKNIKPFCSKIYRRKSKATDLFEVLLKFLKNEDRMDFFEKHNINVTDVVAVIEGYLEKQDHHVKDEF